MSMMCASHPASSNIYAASSGHSSNGRRAWLKLGWQALTSFSTRKSKYMTAAMDQSEQTPNRHWPSMGKCKKYNTSGKLTKTQFFLRIDLVAPKQAKNASTESTNIFHCRELPFENSLFVISQFLRQISRVSRGCKFALRPRGQIFVGIYVIGALFIIANLISDVTNKMVELASESLDLPLGISWGLHDLYHGLGQCHRYHRGAAILIMRHLFFCYSCIGQVRLDLPMCKFIPPRIYLFIHKLAGSPKSQLNLMSKVEVSSGTPILLALHVCGNLRYGSKHLSVRTTYKSTPIDISPTVNSFRPIYSCNSYPNQRDPPNLRST